MVRHYVLTLNGSAQRLSEAIGTGTVQASPNDLPIRTLAIQPLGTNANPVYLGGENATVSSSNYGNRLEAAVSTVPPAPYVLGEFAPGWCRLSDFYVLGTNGEKITLLVDHYL